MSRSRSVPLLWSSFPLLFLIIIFIVSFSFPLADCSRGDRDYTFHECLKQCFNGSCELTNYRNQSSWLQYLGWTCLPECRYHCMWETVQIFQDHGLDIPQFFGKWPFIRLWGMQEPASVAASFLNLIFHVFGILEFRRRVPSTAPLYKYWHFFTLVCINGWIWSIVFHTRDTKFTEIMDYLSAFSMIVVSLLSGFVRACEQLVCSTVMISGSLISTFYVFHIYYLSFVHFDYGYNMIANITIGVFNAAFWLTWSILQRKDKPYTWKCSLFVTLALASIALEILDFPPILWTFDAHSLWHFSTALITPIWYSFLIDDARYLDIKKKIS